MKSVSMGSFKYKNQVNGQFFAYLWVILLYFSRESTLDSNLVKSVCFEFDRCHTAVKQEFESIFQAD